MPWGKTMAACSECKLCDHHGTVSGAVEIGQVPCNVRRFRNEVFTFWRCTGCGSLHCLEDADLARFYADYPLKIQKVTFSERVGYQNRLRLLTHQGLGVSDRILDYGCGAGLFVKFLREKGYRNVFGYDAFVTEYSDVGSLAESYDAVVSYDVIEHADEPRDFMGRLCRLVRPGGLLAIGTPNADHIRIADKDSPSLHAPYHRHILSEGALLALAGEQGVQPAQIYRRSFYDSLIPTVNSRFMWQYIRNSGGVLDAAVEPPRAGVVLGSPKMIFFAFCGYFLPPGDNILVTFRRQ
jgi:SAM-dependent methyltransferase